MISGKLLISDVGVITALCSFVAINSSFLTSADNDLTIQDKKELLLSSVSEKQDSLIIFWLKRWIFKKLSIFNSWIKRKKSINWM